jgi:hypothetical protein
MLTQPWSRCSSPRYPPQPLLPQAVWPHRCLHAVWKGCVGGGRAWLWLRHARCVFFKFVRHRHQLAQGGGIGTPRHPAAMLSCPRPHATIPLPALSPSAWAARLPTCCVVCVDVDGHLGEALAQGAHQHGGSPWLEQPSHVFYRDSVDAVRHHLICEIDVVIQRVSAWAGGVRVRARATVRNRTRSSFASRDKRKKGRTTRQGELGRTAAKVGRFPAPAPSKQRCSRNEQGRRLAYLLSARMLVTSPV